MLVGAAPDGTIRHWSAGAERLFGWSAGEVVGQPLALMVPAEARAELHLHERLEAGEQLAPFVTERLTRDGRRVPVELRLVQLPETGGRPGTLALHRDLRPERQMAAVLSVTAEELHARFADSPVPQARVALDGQVLAVNRALEELLGRPAQDLLGSDGVALYGEQERPEVLAALAQLTAGEVTQLAQEHVIVRADGSEIRTITTVSIVHDEHGGRQLAASVEDVTPLREAQERARVEAGRFEALLQTMPVAVFTYDGEGRCTSSRGRALASLGLVDDQLVGASLPELYEEQPAVLEALLASLAGQDARVSGVVGGRHWEAHYRPLHDAAGGIGIAIDVTELASAEREIRASEARLHSLLRNAADVAFVIDADGQVTYVSPAVRPQLGYDGAEMIGRRATDYNPPEDRLVVARTWAQIKDRPGATARLEVRVRHADGSLRWTEQVLTNLVDDPTVGGVVCNVRDITERRRAEDELRRLAVRDSLTGLANRALLLDRVEQGLSAARRSGSVLGLVVLDVVGMSRINERFGQAGGDRVLQVVAERLESALRGTDSVARVAGDLFGVLAEDVASDEDLRTRTAALLAAGDGPLVLDGTPVEIRLQVGSALSPAEDAGSLLAAAEQAAAQRTGRAPQPARRGRDRAAADRLRAGVAAGEMVLHYQPVVRLDSEQVAGVEALVRWQHPEYGLLPPAQFIPLAEDSGLVVELGAWVLRQACTQLASWRTDDRTLSVGLNLSPRQLVGAAFPALVRQVLDETGVPPGSVVLEVTESALMDDPGAPGVLRSLREMGVHLALDDFGTGYSSLTYLKRFPVDAIKIDRSFVAGLGRDDDDDAIVASVVSLARAVGKTVIAEGVETVPQLDALRALGVDQAQGFLWSRALPAAELVAWLDRPRAVALPAERPPVAPPAAAEPAGDAEQRILELHGQGASLHTIAAALNAEGRRTPAGPRWTTKTVARVVASLVPPV